MSKNAQTTAQLHSSHMLRVGHDWVTSLSLSWLEKEMATHSSVLAWRIPGTEEPVGLPSMGSHRVGHDWRDLAAAAAAATVTFLAWDKGRSVVTVKQTLARLQHMLTLLQFSDEWVLSTADMGVGCPVPVHWQAAPHLLQCVEGLLVWLTYWLFEVYR